MKKNRLLIPVAALGLLLTSCGQVGDLSSYFDNFTDDDIVIPTPWVDYGLPLKSIEFASGEDEITLVKGGEVHTYNYTCTPTDALINWVSDDESVATVSKGVVTPVERGTAHITVSGGEGSTFTPVTLTVHVKVPVTQISLTGQSELTLDYGATSQIQVGFTPSNTTETELSYVSSNTNVATVSNSGLITAGNTTGNSTITITSPHLDTELSVTVHVSDAYKYLTSLTLSAESNSIELGKTTQLSTTYLPTDASYHEVHYSTSTPTIISVSDAGEVTALAEGQGKVKAYINEERKGTNFESNELTIEVFEVKATAISLGTDSKSTLELNNTNNNSHQLAYTYTVDKAGYTEPTRGTVSYESSAPTIASVSSSGIITSVSKGSARITITDTQYNVSDYVDVNVTFLPTKVTVTASKPTPALGEVVTLTATTDPTTGLSDDTITFNNPDPTNVTLTNVSNGQATITSNVEGEYLFTATCSGVTSAAVKVTFKAVFKTGNVYLVGTSDFHTGTSDPTGGASWQAPLKAFELSEDLGQDATIENLNYQRAGTITLAKDDEFKLRLGPTDDDFVTSIVWKEVTPGEPWVRYNHYVIDSGVGIDVIDTDGAENYGQFKVVTAGTYRIIYKIYDLGKANEWYSIDISFPPELRIDKTSLTVQVGHTDTIKADDWFEDTLEVTSADSSIAAVDSVSTQGLITIRGVAAGGPVDITIKDSKKTLKCTVTVTDTPVAHYVTLYFAGVSGWTTISEVLFALDGNWVNAEVTTGADESKGQYKYVFEVTSAPSTVGCWFKQYEEGIYKYRHPTSGTEDYDTNHSAIDLGGVTLSTDSSYAITWTNWHYHQDDNWSHAWFYYTFKKIA